MENKDLENLLKIIKDEVESAYGIGYMSNGFYGIVNCEENITKITTAVFEYIEKLNHLKINTVLFTKDGRFVGNAIITGYKDGLYEIKTDYGNIIRYNRKEIEDAFYISEPELYEQPPTRKHKHFVE